MYFNLGKRQKSNQTQAWKLPSGTIGTGGSNEECIPEVTLGSKNVAASSQPPMEGVPPTVVNVFLLVCSPATEVGCWPHPRPSTFRFKWIPVHEY